MAKVELSENTREFIKKLKALKLYGKRGEFIESLKTLNPKKDIHYLLRTLHCNRKGVPDVLEIEVSALQELLTDTAKWPVPEEQKLHFILQGLESSLLKDICNSEALRSNKNESKDKKKGSWKSKLLLRGLALLGTLYFACEGFDGMTALLGIMSTPFGVLLAGGLIFSIISAFVFYSFDLAEISDNLKVKKKEVPKLLDLYLKEVKTIKKLAAKIKEKSGKAEELEVKEYQATLAMLQVRNDEALKDPREKFKRSSDKIFISVFEKIAGMVGGILFLSSGFFAGQTVALFIVGLLGFSAASAFWPVVLTGLIVGASAALIYWFVERPGIESLIRRKLGLDPEKIEQLRDKGSLKNELDELEELLTQRKEVLDALAKGALAQSENLELIGENKELKAQIAQYQIKEKTMALKASVTEKLSEVGEKESGQIGSTASIADNPYRLLAAPSGNRRERSLSQPIVSQHMFHLEVGRV